jgi:asparagine synthase (glutamine-hydrolysing)
MCGLCGELRRDATADTGAVARMTAALASRGPDGQGMWSAGGVGLGHRRLRIIDLSPAGTQPMIDSDLGLSVVFNGCIYNYRELRDELAGAGYAFFSTSDTEVLLKAYHRWGERFVDHLKGMFAFCIVERDSGRAVLGRDRLGVKPLYLAQVDGALRFASTLPALLAGGGVDTSIDPVALHHYLSWHAVVPAPWTILRGVRKLEPATLLFVEPDGTQRKVRYWDPPYVRREQDAGMTQSDWADAIGEALAVAVKRRMVADVPVGVLLSGGLDSSVIVALLARQGQTGLKTFSIGFEPVGGTKGDEFAYSDLVAREFGTDHVKIEVGADRMLPALAPAIRAMSEPMVSHDTVAFHLLSEEVVRHMTVVQSGQGADEVLAGYHWYPPMVGIAGDARGAGVDEYEAGFFDRTHAEMAEFVAPGLLVDHAVSREFVEGSFADARADSALDRALRLDQQVMLPGDPVMRVDSMTMAWGLEARTPFLDHELVELCALCPPEVKLADGGKGPLKRAARGLVPDAVIDRPKGYFPVPALVQLEGPYLDLVRDALTDPAARARDLWQPAYVDRLLAEPNAHTTPSGANKLWQLGLLELWLQAQGL